MAFQEGEALTRDMSLNRFQEVKRIYASALEQEASRRKAFVREECRGDESLINEVESLLSHRDEANNFFRESALKAGMSLLVEAVPADAPSGELIRLAPSKVLARRFRITRFIARGGMGEVYEAEDLELGERVALKTIRADIAADARLLELFKREIQISHRVTHPNVCRIFDLASHTETHDDGTESILHFFTMELLQGESLSQHLTEHGPYEPARALVLIEQLGTALNAAHKAGVIHRDFKPGNVILVPRKEGEPDRAVITDFGLALPAPTAGDLSVSTPAVYAGTPTYMAPEQMDLKELSPRSDVFSFGLVIAELIGAREERRLFSRSGLHAPPQHRARLQFPRIYKKWRPVLERCLDPVPENRYPDTLAVVQALEEAGTSKTEFSWRWPAVAAAVALLLLLALQSVIPQRARLVWLLANLTGAGSKDPDSFAGARLSFKARDCVLIAGFENLTAEPLLEGTLAYALEREISNSRFVSIATRERVADILALMRKGPDTRIDRNIGKEICLRDAGIKALVTGRVDKVAGSYDLSIEIINPRTGQLLVSTRNTAERQEELLTAIHRLSDWVRQHLGEALTEITENPRQLERVTTPSLKALQLYSLANDAMREGSARAEPLLRQALQADPDFASAEIMLAWHLYNTRIPDYLSHATRAMALSNQCSDRERYFIAGSYYFMMDDEETAVKQYQALLSSYPDDLWAANNLFHTCRRLGWLGEALPYLTKAHEFAPRETYISERIADILLRDQGNLKRAAEYAADVRSVLTPDTVENAPFQTAWANFFPVHEAWVEGRVGDARPEVVRLLKTYESATQDVDTNVREFAARFFLTTGELKRGEGVLRPHGDTSLNSILVELARGDMKVANSNARDFLKKNPRFTSGIATLILVKSGCSAEADQMLRETPRVLKSDSAAIRAEIALQKRRYPLAVGLFRKAISARAFHCYDSYYLAAESLASALQHQGRLAEAIQVLEDAAVQKAATYSSELVLWGRSWILVRAKQAELYRKAGRVAEARLVELDLSKHLAFADPDDVIAARIRR